MIARSMIDGGCLLLVPHMSYEESCAHDQKGDSANASDSVNVGAQTKDAKECPVLPCGELKSFAHGRL